MAGRKTTSAYDLYGFIHKIDNGKHSALCKSCNRVLQNTAATRLQKHRSSCLAARANASAPHPSHFTNSELKRHATPPTQTVQQIEIVNSNVKMEQNNLEFEDASIENTFDDTMDNLQDYLPSRKSTAKKENKIDEKLRAKIQYFKEKSKYLINETNNLKIEKTMMVLEVKKLGLEINQLEMNN